ncbi:DNA endonuclease [Sporosarcina oncorhynchi]|uniref:DNA endonuclease n=1 Tax=Sporosarcina oncorhynchi TaxID=3056444 RepID=A0ABZ0L768_9BACL|nr:DNA endonuclease [Sporosarcina sp. T2O-4]WOV88358.1 DNA endonuclease [Sporosarcina sp. T2O-4]
MLLCEQVLSPVQLNILVGSILGDGTLTKIQGRRINSNYRERFGKSQLAYREWKVAHLSDYLYFNKTRTEISSKSQSMFTKLEKLFYGNNRIKQIPPEVLKLCTLPHFLATLYMDDGSLMISYRINHRLKKIYMTPHIALYLQSFTKEELELLNEHVTKVFKVKLRLSQRNDGNGYILKTTTVDDTFRFLDVISEVTTACPSMYYKTNWQDRLNLETMKWKSKYPDYEILTSSRQRSKKYSEDEIDGLIKMKLLGYTINEIAYTLDRTYWSTVYKWREITKESERLINV